MKTLPTVNTLQPILHNQIPVITTEFTGNSFYGTEPCVSPESHENKVRFDEGKHFFKVL